MGELLSFMSEFLRFMGGPWALMSEFNHFMGEFRSNSLIARN
jgi:hypothetical protein